jgi:hypothetical protein
MTIVRLMLATLALTLAGCAAIDTHVVALDPAQHYAPSANVEVLLQKPTRPYTEVGLIESRGDIGISELALLEDAREKAKALGADAIIRTETQSLYHPPVAVYDPWYDPLYFGYYRYRTVLAYPYPWGETYRLLGGGVSYVLKAVAIRFQPVTQSSRAGSESADDA